MFRHVLVVVAAAWLALPSSAAGQPPVTAEEMARIPRITVKEFAPLHAKGTVLTIDVRDPHGYDAGHIPGAMNVSIVDIEIMANKVLRDKRPVVAYCSCPDEHASLTVAAKLARVGVKDIKVLLGGWDAWKKSGGKVEMTPTQ
ncbi:MAG: rhodanese-like domain-containing protein [Vicinamibacterales bacterium]